MTDDRTGKRPPPEQREQERAVQARGQHRDEPDPERKRKASPIERREWRGSGVCGDRHTD